MLINPKAVVANGEITAIASAKYLRIDCQKGVVVGVEDVLIGMNNSTSKNPKGRTAAPTIANLENCLPLGSFFERNELFIS